MLPQSSDQPQILSVGTLASVTHVWATEGGPMLTSPRAEAAPELLEESGLQSPSWIFSAFLLYPEKPA